MVPRRMRSERLTEMREGEEREQEGIPHVGKQLGNMLRGADIFITNSDWRIMDSFLYIVVKTYALLCFDYYYYFDYFGGGVPLMDHFSDTSTHK